MPSIDLRSLLQRTLTANTDPSVANENERVANTNEPANANTNASAAKPPNGRTAEPVRLLRHVAPPRGVRQPPRTNAPVPMPRALRPRRRT